MIRQRVFDSRDEFINQSAFEILRLTRLALRRHGACAMVLAGGNSPRPVYEALGRALTAGKVNPEALHFFMGDERHVPADDPDRNTNMVEDSLFRAFPPSRNNVVFWDTPPLSPEECAVRYNKMIGEFFTSHNRTPDITLLGLGADGHTASLFPGGETIDERGLHHPLTVDAPGNALAVWVPQKRVWRLCLSARFLSSSEQILFLTGSAGKEEAIKKLLSGDKTIPAGWIDGKRNACSTVIRYT